MFCFPPRPSNHSLPAKAWGPQRAQALHSVPSLPPSSRSSLELAFAFLWPLIVFSRTAGDRSSLLPRVLLLAYLPSNHFYARPFDGKPRLAALLSPLFWILDAALIFHRRDKLTTTSLYLDPSFSDSSQNEFVGPPSARRSQ